MATFYYETGTGGIAPAGAISGWDPYHFYYRAPGDGIDTIDGGADYDTLTIFGIPVLYDDKGKGYGGNSFLKVVVKDGAITSINGGKFVSVESHRPRPWLLGGRRLVRRREVYAGLRRHDRGRDREPCDWYGDRLRLRLRA